MNRLRFHRTALLFTLQALCLTDVLPAATGRREQIIEYQDGQIVPLQVMAGRGLTVRFPARETVRDIALPDADADVWQVTKNRSRDRIVVQALRPQGTGYISITTSMRRYTFGLSVVSSATDGSAFDVVRLRSTPGLSGPAAGTSSAVPQITYRLRGDRALYPTNVSTDGTRTYIDWAPDVPLPAVYAIDAAGREALVNGNMRAGRYVIDSVEAHLVFRIDKYVASAVRTAPGARR